MTSHVQRIEAEGPAPFLFYAESARDTALRVLSFQGQEAISRPYRIDVRLATSALDADGLTAALLGSRARLSIDVPGTEPRAVHGVVSRVWAEGVLEQDRAALKVRIVPRLWALKKRRTCRIFQDKTVPEILAALFAQAGVPHRSALHRRYQPRIYCVQHQETDFAFAERLLGEEGIFYFFEQASEGEVLVLADNAHSYTNIAGSPELAYRWGGGDGLAVKEHHVTRFALRRGVEPSSVLHRDYDFKRPTLDLRAEQAANDIKPEHGHVYDHHGADEAPDVGAETAAVQLEQHRRSAALAEGHSTCRRLAPGYRFTLADHDMGELNQEYVLASVEHAGRAPEITKGRELVYEASFSCAPATVPLRPKRPKRRIQQVTETALVVGPEGEEIYTDEHGRVKVQFHWDLEGKRNEHSSCWIRVSQAWAGTHWGFQFIPRIGMEVVVTFLGGDTDRPLITGCVPNAVNPPPFKLPEGKTRSGVRTRSTPDGTGHNELSFEDAKGREQVLLRAELDFHERIGHDHTIDVGHNQSTRVGAAQHQTVEGDQTENILGGQRLTVGGDRAVVVRGDWSSAAGGDRREEITGQRRTTIQGRDTQTVNGAAHASYEDDYAMRVEGHHSVSVGLDRDKSRSTYYVRGDHLIGAAGVVKVSADKGLVFQCGESMIEVTHDRIKLSSPKVILEGAESAELAGPGPRLSLGEKAELVTKELALITPEASLVLKKDASIRGKRVLLNCDNIDAVKPKDDDGPTETRLFQVAVKDPDLVPCAEKRYVLLVDGRTHEGKTGPDGKVERRIPKDAERADLTVWADEWPTGRKLSWHFELAELPPNKTLRGAQIRLKNLGYYEGDPTDEPNDATRLAVQWFQRDHDLDETGTLDDATYAALDQAHGH